MLEAPVFLLWYYKTDGAEDYDKLIKRQKNNLSPYESLKENTGYTDIEYKGKERAKD